MLYSAKNIKFVFWDVKLGTALLDYDAGAKDPAASTGCDAGGRAKAFGNGHCKKEHESAFARECVLQHAVSGIDGLRDEKAYGRL